MGRRPPIRNLDGQNEIHAPGAYEHVLRVTCTEAGDDYMGWLDASDDLVLLAAFEAAQADRIESLIEMRRGAPVHCQGYQLASGNMPPHPASWRGETCFTVTPDDVITCRFCKTD